jgi:hypothetical protein
MDHGRPQGPRPASRRKSCCLAARVHPSVVECFAGWWRGDVVARMQGAALVAVRAHPCPRGRGSGRIFTLQLPPTLRAHALHHQSLLCRHLTGLVWGIMAMMQGLRSLSLAPPPAYTLSPASRATTTPHSPIATFETSTQNAPQALWITDGHKGRTLPVAENGLPGGGGGAHLRLAGIVAWSMRRPVRS